MRELFDPAQERRHLHVLDTVEVPQRAAQVRVEVRGAPRQGVVTAGVVGLVAETACWFWCGGSLGAE
jgi:hypothetical protein